jgi:myo-inositol catabolism protein IolC
VDEAYGAEVARRAHAAGRTLAMPVEKSGQDEFDFEYGEAFGRHIEQFDPAFAKVLVRYNPGGDRELNARQTARLRRLSEWLRERDRKFLFELLVPAEQDQLASVGGSQERYDAELRPSLVVRTMQEQQAAGVEPDIWKIEGFEHRDDCVRAVAQARSGGRDGVVCIVLGRGADEAKVLHWLQQAADVPGYAGFAVGRTIWWDALARYVARQSDGDAASAEIARTYARLVEAYASSA